MSVSDTHRRAGPYIGDDRTTEFPFFFQIFKQSDVRVVVVDDDGNAVEGQSIATALVKKEDLDVYEQSAFSVVLNADQESNPGGTVELATPLRSGYALVVVSNVPYEQSANLINQGGLYPEVIEEALDKLEMQIQQLREESSRSVKVPVTSDQTQESFTKKIFDAEKSASLSAENAKASELSSAQNNLSSAEASESARQSASEANTHAESARTSLGQIGSSVADASASAREAKTAETNATASADRAERSAQGVDRFAEEARLSAENAKTSETNAQTSAYLSASHAQSALEAKDIAASSVQLASSSASASRQSATEAQEAVQSIGTSVDEASASAREAKTAETNAREIATAIQSSVEDVSSAAEQVSSNIQSAIDSASLAQVAEQKAKEHETNALASELNAKTSENNSKSFETSAKDQANRAFGEAERAKAFADGAAQGQIQSDWSESDSASKSFIRNKPDLNGFATTSALDVTDQKAEDALNRTMTPGATFTPHVSADGMLSWSNDGGLSNPATVKVKGADGRDGADGTDGQPGIDGVDGKSATIRVGEVVSLPHGWTPTAENVGTENATVLKFGFPVPLDGVDGTDGTSATVTIGTVSVLPEGATPTVKNVGTSRDAILNFGIPRGQTGATGATGTVDPSALETRIPKTGDRGSLAGKENASVLSGSQTITVDSSDTVVLKTADATTLTFTSAPESVCAVKVIALHADGATTLTVNGAVWSNAGEVPSWGTQGKSLILVAHFIGGRVVLSVSDNDEA